MATQPAPEIREVLDQMEEIGVLPFHALSVDGARDHLEELRASPDEPEPVGRVRNVRADGPAGDLPLRVYEPEAGDGPYPALVWFHGGGFVLGNLDTADLVCRALCNATGRTVVSVNYRHAPEHPFPAAPEDCYAGTRWSVDNSAALNIDPDRVAVGGSSAGGALAAAAAQIARDRGGPDIERQVLVYPVTNKVRDFESYEENGEGYYLTAADMAWFHDHYLDRAVDARHPYAYPLEARNLSALPPATVITAGFDPLRDEGIAYADRLADAGVDTAYHHYPEMIHGFFGFIEDPEIDRAWDAIDQVAADLG